MRNLHSRLFCKELHTKGKFNPFCINISLSVGFGYQPSTLALNSASYSLELHRSNQASAAAGMTSIDIFELRKVLVSQETKLLKKPVPLGFIFELSLVLFSKKRYDLLIANKEDFHKLKAGLEAILTLRDVLLKYKPQGK